MENQEEIEYIHLEWDHNVYGQDPENVTEYPLYKAYLQSVIDSEGFDVNDEILKDDEEDDMGILVQDRDLDRKSLVESATIAVEEFNRLKGTDLVFRRLVRACVVLVNGLISYLTLECTDGRFYEAKIYEPTGGRPVKLSIFRPAKHYHPTPSKRENSEDGSVSLGSNSDKSEIRDDSANNFQAKKFKNSANNFL